VNDPAPALLRLPPELDVPSIGPTDRLVGLPALRLTSSRDGSLPRLSTSVRVARRGGELLVRFDGRDAGVVATRTRRDDALWTEDVFEVFLTPHDPPTLYYEFEVNPLGALFDARVESPEGRRETMRVDVEWNCPGFRARVARRPDRWSARIAIPLGPLGGAAEPVWRANFFRIDRGSGSPDEFTAWSPTGADPPDFHRPDRFGILRFA
jgi:hypothetical protein